MNDESWFAVIVGLIGLAFLVAGVRLAVEAVIKMYF
jgi:hypothetical protein